MRDSHLALPQFACVRAVIHVTVPLHLGDNLLHGLVLHQPRSATGTPPLTAEHCSVKARKDRTVVFAMRRGPRELSASAMPGEVVPLKQVFFVLRVLRPDFPQPTEAG